MSRAKLLIVGGVAGGASCAARARRLSEDSEIIMFERGSYVSFANCGLPYYVGKRIKKEEDLIVASPAFFKKRFRIDVRIESNVRRIDRDSKAIEIEDLSSGKVYQETYDALLLSPGSFPIKPRIKGVDMPGIFTIWTIPDMREIVDWIQHNSVSHATVVGGGFIGLEMAENLMRLGISVTIVEMQPHVMPALDLEIASFIHDHLISKKIELRLGEAISRFAAGSKRPLTLTLRSQIKSGVVSHMDTDLAILSAGVLPRIELAEQAGLAIGDSGGIKVDSRMQTSDPCIWAVGDAVEVEDFVTEDATRAPLAGPANRQGRIAADVIMAPAEGLVERPSFRGSQRTAVCGVLGMTIASTGATEKALKQTRNTAIANYEKIYLHPDNHAGYYPGAKTITIKLIFSKDDGRILGAQAVGFEGVEKRIDVIAMAIQMGGTVFDLEAAELCYAPQYGSAKDPVNMAGMIASNVIRGYSTVVHWEDIAASNAMILDVREPREFKKGSVAGAISIPLDILRDQMADIPKDQEIWVHCLAGQRSYIAERILKQHGYRVCNLSGGYRLFKAVEKTDATR